MRNDLYVYKMFNMILLTFKWKCQFSYYLPLFYFSEKTKEILFLATGNLIYQ